MASPSNPTHRSTRPKSSARSARRSKKPAGAKPGQPIRLRVSYPSPEGLVSEVTRSLARGGTTLNARRPLPAGTQFLFELHVEGSVAPVRMRGEVLAVGPQGKDRCYPLKIGYSQAADPEGALPAILDRILGAQGGARKAPRVPVNLLVDDEDHPGRRYLAENLSAGGMRLRLPEDRSLATSLRPGTAVSLTIGFEGSQSVQIDGSVAWVMAAGRAVGPQIGVRFELAAEQGRKREAIAALIRLRRPAAISIRFF